MIADIGKGIPKNIMLEEFAAFREYINQHSGIFLEGQKTLLAGYTPRFSTCIAPWGRHKTHTESVNWRYAPFTRIRKETVKFMGGFKPDLLAKTIERTLIECRKSKLDV